MTNSAATQVESPAGSLTAAPQVLSPARWYVLIVLSLVYAINIADRYVVSTVLEPIRLDLQLTDSGVAFLTGVSLALFYVTIGIPLAALADRSNRRNIVALAVIMWSVMTALCGMSRNFWQLLLSRIGVGVGEAGGTPASCSIISDYFPATSRPMAMTVYTLGAPLGAWMGAELAGKIADAYGWRAAFIALAIPGVALGLLILVTLRESRRGGLDHEPAATTKAVPLEFTLRLLWGHRSAMNLMMAGAMTALWGWGLMWWTPTFLMRTYAMSAGEAGAVLGPMHLIAGSAAVLLTSRIMASSLMRDPRRIMWFMAGFVALITGPSFVIYWTQSRSVAVAMLWIFIPAIYFYIGPSLALLQNVVPAAIRSQTIAITLLMANVANLVIAPQAVGMMSDWFAQTNGADAASLRWALLCLAPTGFWAAYHYWASARTFEVDQARAAEVLAARV